jgi:competence protein ComEA
MRMPSISRGRALVYAAAVLLVLALGGRHLLDGSKARESASSPEAPTPVGLEATPAPTRTVVVHVVGAVRRPGLYELPEGSRVDRAIRRAGGPKTKAALELLNLAAPLADGQQVVLPTRATPPAAVEAAEGVAPTGASSPIHLNTATFAELDLLPGVGPVTAQKILDYRQAHGAFRSVEELDAVAGIGPTRLEQLRELVQL